MRDRFTPFLTVLSRPAVALGGALMLGVALIGYAWHATAVSPSGSVVPVTVGPITGEIDVSGVVQAAHRADLAFQVSGRVAAIRVAVGDQVAAGQTLVTLDASSQVAAVALAQANLEAQQARLASIESGTRPEELAIDETDVTQAENALGNALAAAYASVDDAVHARADQVFTNPRNGDAQLAVLVPDATLVNRVQGERDALEPRLSSWQARLMVASSPEGLVASSEADLKSLMSFLDDLAAALAEAQPSGAISSAALVGYQAMVNVGRGNVLAARAALVSADTAYHAAAGALALARAGATQNDIDAQKAAVDAAQASLDAAQAALRQTAIVAPTSGTITRQDADLGETVVPGVPLVSIIADGKYQATARLSDADIAKVAVGERVEVSSVAYPGVTFPAVVTTVDPSASTEGGVASYGVTVTFVDDDARLLPGLSANLRIITATVRAALLVPTSALLTDGNQKFVYVKRGAEVLRVSVITGIESADGMTEIISGLAKGDRVLAFGTPTAP